jgi:hypothetical protein
MKENFWTHRCHICEFDSLKRILATFAISILWNALLLHLRFRFLETHCCYTCDFDSRKRIVATLAISILWNASLPHLPLWLFEISILWDALLLHSQSCCCVHTLGELFYSLKSFYWNCWNWYFKQNVYLVLNASYCAFKYLRDNCAKFYLKRKLM